MIQLLRTRTKDLLIHNHRSVRVRSVRRRHCLSRISEQKSVRQRIHISRVGIGYDIYNSRNNIMSYIKKESMLAWLIFVTHSFILLACQNVFLCLKYKISIKKIAATVFMAGRFCIGFVTSFQVKLQY